MFLSKILQEYIIDYEKVMLDNKDRFFMSLRGGLEFKDQAPEEFQNIQSNQILKGTRIFKDRSDNHLLENFDESQIDFSIMDEFSDGRRPPSHLSSSMGASQQPPSNEEDTEIARLRKENQNLRSFISSQSHHQQKFVNTVIEQN